MQPVGEIDGLAALAGVPNRRIMRTGKWRKRDACQYNVGYEYLTLAYRAARGMEGWE